MAHTPGPRLSIVNRSSRRFPNWCIIDTHSEHGDYFGPVGGFGSEEDAQAYLDRLIAAAPEMLELIRLAATFDFPQGFSNRARAILRAVEG